MRLLQTSEMALPALRGRLQKNASDAQLCTTLKLSGRKMLLVRQREEAAQALCALNDVRTERLRDRITQWQFFHRLLQFSPMVIVSQRRKINDIS